jgi:hypothetical protein
MLTSVEARDLEEDLASVDMSIGDLTRGSGAMAGKDMEFWQVSSDGEDDQEDGE